MSIRVMSNVWDNGPSSQGPLLVMLALADYANDAGECWPSIKSISEKARMTERGVQKIIRVLEADGWVNIDTGNGRKGCNKYRINPERRDTPEQGTPRTSTPKTPNVDAETPNVATPEPSRTISEPSEEPPLSPKRSKRAISIPENWVPSDRNISDANDRQFSAEEIQNEALQFRDYHLAKGTTFKDWDAGWRTWLGNARKFGKGRGVAGKSFSAGRGQGGGIAGAVARRRLAGEN